MSRANWIKVVVGAVLILIGVLVAALPKDWIEETFNIEPDEGNGVLELPLAVVPIAIGGALCTYALLSHRRQHAA
jgi:hypothetical protein